MPLPAPGLGASRHPLPRIQIPFPESAVPGTTWPQACAAASSGRLSCGYRPPLPECQSAFNVDLELKWAPGVGQFYAADLTGLRGTAAGGAVRIRPPGLRRPLYVDAGGGRGHLRRRAGLQPGLAAGARRRRAGRESIGYRRRGATAREPLRSQHSARACRGRPDDVAVLGGAGWCRRSYLRFAAVRIAPAANGPGRRTRAVDGRRCTAACRSRRIRGGCLAADP